MITPDKEGETFISHLIELRDRLVRAIIGLFVVCVALMIWPGPAPIYDILAQPMMAALPAGAKMISTGVVDPFLVPMKVTLLLAFLLSLPWTFYQAWAFIAPGLYAHEKKAGFAAGVFLFRAVYWRGGVLLLFSCLVGCFAFIYSFAPESISVAPDVGNYLDFVITMCLAFGVCFEVPVVEVVLVRMGMVTVEKLKAIRPYMIVGAFVIAAIVTPPDVV